MDLYMFLAEPVVVKAMAQQDALLQSGCFAKDHCPREQAVQAAARAALQAFAATRPMRWKQLCFYRQHGRLPSVAELRTRL